MEPRTNSPEAHEPRGARALRLAWSEAPARLAAHAQSLGPATRLAGAGTAESRVVIGITGPVGAGKSTLAAMISRCILATDNYLPDYELVPEAERDEARHADGAALAQNIADLRAGRVARVPRWSFQTHRREGFTQVEPAEIIIVEGIHALAPHALPLLDIAVFVEAPRDVRWRRWEVLESTGKRGWGVEKARTFFGEVAEPTFEKHAALYRAMAHVVVENGAGVSAE
jgi:uridine kinase